MFMMPIAINQVDIATLANLVAPVCEYQVLAQSQRGTYGNLMPWMPHGTISSLDFANDRSAAWLLLYELAKLEPNWDAYGAEPIDRGCVENVRAILASLSPAVPSPEITPNPNGTLTLDWETEDQALSLELGSTRFSSFWESRHGIKTKSGMLSQCLPDFVAVALDSLFPDYAQTQPLYEGFMIDAKGPSGLATPLCYG